MLKILYEMSKYKPIIEICKYLNIKIFTVWFYILKATYNP